MDDTKGAGKGGAAKPESGTQAQANQILADNAQELGTTEAKKQSIKEMAFGHKVRKGLTVAGTAMGWLGGLFALGAGGYMIATRNKDRMENPANTRR